ncbi:SIR2 family histone deacetylase [Cordyceps fumosorosea ARSEF 2679]|uniref:NAD-dependent protein deacetylase n=1 Tax=Cordyceps fumosorosea (strain ARSEF 2679) TaxID=1081104 RepID=A0A167MZB7_CORFA|nr:SIR2 family histone deacetylase [Cordyceps fumosorosea ARSEF 2679]OAA54939.1 SIR2 family histone deacetylase [Cordyceps fumosorosea ARSEF 2679]
MGQEESAMVDESTPPTTLSERSISAIADYIKSGDVKRIVVMTGAGISTAAGIPDFRSPKTGLYNNLARLNLPHAEAVFEISYFKENPEPFYVLAKELYPGKFHPTVSHVFLSLLEKKGLLQMLFTQNIDCLERSAGVPPEKIIEAHGSFATQRCVECKKEFPDDEMRTHVHNGDVPRCVDMSCNGLVKPDIVFFGEALPREFSEQSYKVVMADLVLIIGTSLQVYPFAGLPKMVRESIPRVLFNLEKVGQIGTRPDDVLSLGPCDDGIRQLAADLGWGEELEKMWRGIVGDEEAERQLRSQQERTKEVDEEVQRLTEDIETALRIHDEESASNEAVASKSHQSEETGPSNDNILKYETDAAEGTVDSAKRIETPPPAGETAAQDKAVDSQEALTERRDSDPQPAL